LIKRFEDLEVWQKGCSITKQIYILTRGEAFNRDYGLKDQIRRASVSIPSNIAEGFERESPKDYCRFLLIAKGSCGEVRTQLYIAQSLGYVDSEQFNSLNMDCCKLSAMLSNLIRAIQSTT